MERKTRMTKAITKTRIKRKMKMEEIERNIWRLKY